ncbi:MAG: hypothetical protein AAGI49_19635, partial [Bacteroidota bacterium]
RPTSMKNVFFCPETQIQTYFLDKNKFKFLFPSEGTLWAYLLLNCLALIQTVSEYNLKKKQDFVLP